MNEYLLSKLLIDLASIDPTQAENAQHELQQVFGASALPQVLSILPQLNAFSRICAIEFIQACPIDTLREKKNEIIKVLLPFLKDENATVREWVTDTLGLTGDSSVVPYIKAAQKAAKEQQIPLDYSEQGGYRRALTALGARSLILPERARELQTVIKDFDFAWDANAIAEVIELLAQEKQVILSLQCWKEDVDLRGVKDFFDEDIPSHHLDFSKSWLDVVADSKAASLKVLQNLNNKEQALFVVEWIDESDCLIL